MNEYKRGTRVVVTEDLPGIPEGTPGKCGRGLGFAIKRYRVRFDNDIEAISVAHSKLVPEDQWPQFLAKRARAEIDAAQDRARIAEQRAAAAESRGLPAASTDDSAAEVAPEAAPAAEAAAESSSDDGGGDPRLAALMARAKSAREATGVAAPEASAPAATESEAQAAAPTPEPAAKPPRATPPSGPERVEVPEFVPGPEVDPGYAPEANRISELMNRVRDGD